jgi:RNA polymerase sigma factor (sigma-70 family)
VTASDTDLIARVVLRDDRAAFGELVQRHQSAVRRFLRHLSGGDNALSDDLAQETFVQAYRSLPQYRGEGQFGTWLFGIAHNHFRNSRRRAHREAEFAATETAPEAGAPVTRAVELGQDLAAALRHLSADEQTAVHLFYHQGLSHPEIAAVVGWPLGTVKTHLTRSKEKLRSLLRVWNPQT